MRYATDIYTEGIDLHAISCKLIMNFWKKFLEFEYNFIPVFIRELSI